MKIDVAFTATQSAVGGKWKDIIKKVAFKNGKLNSWRFRPSQREIYEKHGDSRFFLMIEASSSGKSTAVRFCAGRDIIENPCRKVIISIPTEGIAKTFRGDGNADEVLLDFGDGTIVHWSVGNDLCRRPMTGTGKTDSVVDFLKRRHFTEDHRERVLLCTHASLALAYKRVKKLPKSIRQAMFKETTVVIDEAHHILDTRDFNGGEVNNRIGSLVNFIVGGRAQIAGSKVWLATATYVRGDCLDILCRANARAFETYYLPLDKHWNENIKYLKSYQYGFVNYHGDEIFGRIEEIFRDHRKTIIYCPRSNSELAQRHTNGCKLAFRDRVIQAIRNAWPKADILDLVSTNGREDKKQKTLMVAKELAKKDVVLTIGMLDEGIDWPECEQILELVPSESFRVACQRFGRLLRDIPGKKKVYYTAFLPTCLVELTDREGYRRHLNAAHARLNDSFLLEDSIQPVMVPKSGEDKDDTPRDGTPNWFRRDVPDDNDRNALLTEIEHEWCFRKGEADAREETFTSDTAAEILMSILKRRKLKHAPQVARHIMAMFQRRFLHYGKGMEWAVDAGFDKVIEGLLGFVAKGCGVKTFAQYRQITMKAEQVEWSRLADEFIIFHREKGRHPKADSTDEAESRLGKWLEDELNNKSMKKEAEAQGFSE